MCAAVFFPMFLISITATVAGGSNFYEDKKKLSYIFHILKSQSFLAKSRAQWKEWEIENKHTHRDR